jgi:hypothetical protein
MHFPRIFALLLLVALLGACTQGADPPASKPAPGSSSKPKTSKPKPKPKSSRPKPPPKKASSLPKKTKRPGSAGKASKTKPTAPPTRAPSGMPPRSAKAIRPSRMAGSVGKYSGRVSPTLADLKRTIEWDLAASVVLGTVKTLQRLDQTGKAASQGPRFVVTMNVAKVLKGTGVKTGDTLRLEGWATGSKRQLYIPPASESVWAFLKKGANGRHDLLVPSGFRNPRPDKMKRESSPSAGEPR